MSTITPQAAVLAELASIAVDARDIIDRVLEQELTVASEYEREAGAVRTRIAAAIADVDELWGARGWPTITSYQALAARLADLRQFMVEDQVPITITIERPTSCIELAVELYQDYTRWTEIADLNRRTMPHPGFLRPGQEVLVHAS